MKNPNTARGARAFPVTSDATVVRATNATDGTIHARPTDRRFYWDMPSNSVQTLNLRIGRGCHE